MRIIGIDPGTIITGIGIIECKGNDIKPVYYGTVNLKQKTPLPERLKAIYDKCSESISKYKPDQFAIETAFYSNNIQSTLKLGQARGVAIISAANRDISISEYSPREVKKSVTGNGASSKEQVRFMVKRILNIIEDPEYIDSTDALAVAICHYHSTLSFVNGNDKNKKYGWKKFIEENPEKVIPNK